MSKAYPCVYFDNGKCKKFSDEKYTSWCIEGACGDETPSNADRIRSMSDEELATFIYTATMACNNYECESCPIGDENCPDLYKWLKQPAEE